MLSKNNQLFAFKCFKSIIYASKITEAELPFVTVNKRWIRIIICYAPDPYLMAEAAPDR